MRKPVYAIFEQQRRRSACASAQSAHSLISTFVVGCLDTIIPETFTCYIHNFRTLASLWSGVGRFESYVVENPKDKFSRDEAQFRVPKALLSLRTSKFWNKIWLRMSASGGSRGGSGGSSEPPLEPKLFHFHGGFQEKLVKLHKSNPPQLIWTPHPKILDSPLSSNPQTCEQMPKTWSETN